MSVNKVIVSTPGPAGETGINFRGSWDSETQYFFRDLVRYSQDGNLYFCTSTPPSAGELPTSTTYFSIFSSVNDVANWTSYSQYQTFTDSLGVSGYSAKHYVLQSKDWASRLTTQVRSDDNSTGVDYSSKEYAIGTSVPAGSSKEWATTTGATVDGTEYSAKEYATGTTVPTGSAKEWANVTGAFVASSEYSAKEYATGTTVTSSKQWAIGGGATFDRDTAVSGTDYSAKYYAYQASLDEAATSDDRTDAQNLAVAAHNTTFALTASNGGTTGLYSAKHYATEAATSASNAANSESASSDDATDAQNLAVAAHNTSFNLTTSNGGDTGLYSALHYATEAASSESASSDDVTDAQNLAVATHNTSFNLTTSNGGNTGLYSALHYATEAASSASAASTSEGNASTSEGNAATSAGEAEDSNLTAQSYAVDIGAVTKTFTGGTGSNTTDYSAKEWAIGTTVPDGSAKNWAAAAAASAAAAGDAPIIFAIALG